MNHRRWTILPLAVALLITAVFANLAAGLAIVEAITPADVAPGPNYGAWYRAVETSGGRSDITDAVPDSLAGLGSLEQVLPAPTTPKTDFQLLSESGVEGFGLLAQRDALSFEWYRDGSSTAPAHLTPAFRLFVYDPDWPDGPSSFLLVWEGTYNGYVSAPVDAWVSEDLLNANFWRIPQFINGAWQGIGGCDNGTDETAWQTCYVFDNDLDEWAFSANATIIGMNIGLGSGWAGTYRGYSDFVTLGFSGEDSITYDFEPLPAPAVPCAGPDACVYSDPPDALLVCNRSEYVDIVIDDVADLYGYQFVVTYDPLLVSAGGTFVDDWLNSTAGLIPGGWGGTCAGGTCRFAVTLARPGDAVSGSGTVARIALAPLNTGTANLTISGQVLTDRNGFVIPSTIQPTPLSVSVCGSTTVDGEVALQGRLPIPVDDGLVRLKSADFPGTLIAPFSGATGLYSFTNVPALPGGSDYRFEAAHQLYLDNELEPVKLFPAVPYTAAKTTLRGGDANNDGVVNILDAGCIGGDYDPDGPPPPIGDCGGQGSPDINADGVINILDLAIMGGNYQETTFQPW